MRIIIIIYLFFNKQKVKICFCRQEILSDEEAQEVTRLLSPVDNRNGQWHPNASSSLLQDSSGPNSLLDSTGPQSLNSMDPSFQDSYTESMAGSYNDSAGPVCSKDATSAPCIMKESISSIDVSSFDDCLISSKMETSISDSGLIGNLILFNPNIS